MTALLLPTPSCSSTLHLYVSLSHINIKHFIFPLLNTFLSVFLLSTYLFFLSTFTSFSPKASCWSHSCFPHLYTSLPVFLLHKPFFPFPLQFLVCLHPTSSFLSLSSKPSCLPYYCILLHIPLLYIFVSVLFRSTPSFPSLHAQPSVFLLHASTSCSPLHLAAITYSNTFIPLYLVGFTPVYIFSSFSSKPLIISYFYIYLSSSFPLVFILPPASFSSLRLTVLLSLVSFLSLSPTLSCQPSSCSQLLQLLLKIVLL